MCGLHGLTERPAVYRRLSHRGRKASACVAKYLTDACPSFSPDSVSLGRWAYAYSGPGAGPHGPIQGRAVRAQEVVQYRHKQHLVFRAASGIVRSGRRRCGLRRQRQERLTASTGAMRGGLRELAANRCTLAACGDS